MVAAMVRQFESNDAGLRQARDMFGDGSMAYIAARAAMVEVVAARAFRHPQYAWLDFVDGYCEDSPVLGGFVRRHVLDRLTRLAFEPLGAWMESMWPWMFAEVADGDDDVRSTRWWVE